MKMSFAVSLLGAVALMATVANAQPRHGGMGEACAADIKTHCADAKPGQPTMQCVQKNRDKMSDGCKAAMAVMRNRAPGQGQGMGQGMGQMGGQGMGGGQGKAPEGAPKPQ